MDILYIVHKYTNAHKCMNEIIQSTGSGFPLVPILLGTVRTAVQGHIRENLPNNTAAIGMIS